ncbi:class I adenylate-forming enzyme family protein [Aquamicrobium ahrensii]|uniref:Fatty-acyl-CoA synthase n=1 Tax=Aquamicrobium ahrensii TaxID=469551 RepID=A0ABV2KP92_9HYPH
MPNIYQSAMFNAERFPGKIAVSDAVTKLDFGQFCRRARALAKYLESFGVRRGERVAIMGDNSIDYLALMHATAITGFILVPVNIRYNVDELLYLIDDCEPKVLLIDAALSKISESIADKLSGRVVVLHSLPDDLPDPDLPALTTRFGDVEDGDVSLILYTSGTTSRPKGAMLTHGNLVWNAINYIVELGINETARAILATPLFHVGGFGVVNGPVLYAGGSLHILPRFEPASTMATLMEVQPTHLFLLSTMWVGLTDMKDFTTHRISSVTFVQTAAAPLGEWRQEHIRQVFHNAEFSWGFGQTESCVTTIKNRYTHEIMSHPGSTGYFWRHFSYRFVDEQRRLLEDQKGPGILEIKGPTIFSGYWRQPDLTRETLTSDGWLHTGDIIRIDEDGFAYFLGRSKDMIKTGGENVAALEVENCLARHESVMEAAVFGVPHEYWGEELVAAVVAAAGCTVDAGELRDFCRQHLAGFKVPKRIFIVDGLPHSSSGKVQKFMLKEKISALLDQ